MSNNKLLSYKELAKRYYTDLTEWCKSQQESDLYINPGKVDTLLLKANLTPSLNDVVYGLREDGHTDKAENLKSAIADAKKAIEGYDYDNENSNISETQLRRKAQWLMEKIVSLADELKALFRPKLKQTAETKSKKRGRPEEHSEDKLKAAKTLFDELRLEDKSVNECWLEVSTKLGFKSPAAAKQAVYRLDKQNKIHK